MDNFENEVRAAMQFMISALEEAEATAGVEIPSVQQALELAAAVIKMVDDRKQEGVACELSDKA